MNARAFVLLAWLALAGCANPNLRPAQPDGEPIRGLAVVVLMGNLSALPDSKISIGELAAYRTRYKDALEKRLPAIFQANGVPVKAVTVRLVAMQSTLRPDPVLADARFSHALVLNGRSVTTVSRRGVRQLFVSVNFTGELWSSASKRVVWSAEQALAVVESQPLLQTQSFAAELLNRMHADGLIALKPGYAVDFAGARIVDYDVGMPDR